MAKRRENEVSLSLSLASRDSGLHSRGTRSKMEGEGGETLIIIHHIPLRVHDLHVTHKS